jgi:hypothetical protein
MKNKKIHNIVKLKPYRIMTCSVCVNGYEIYGYKTWATQSPWQSNGIIKLFRKENIEVLGLIKEDGE